jgi:hypothetical protein
MFPHGTRTTTALGAETEMKPLSPAQLFQESFWMGVLTILLLVFHLSHKMDYSWGQIGGGGAT